MATIRYSLNAVAIAIPIVNANTPSRTFILFHPVTSSTASTPYAVNVLMMLPTMTAQQFFQFFQKVLHGFTSFNKSINSMKL